MRRLLALLGIGALALVGLLGWANLHHPALPPKTKVDKVLLLKSDRSLVLLDEGKVVASYPVSLGARPVGPKQREGDGRTPEGRYIIDYHNRASSFFKSLHVSYPSGADRARAQREGVSPGGMIMIHGLPPRFAWLGRLHLFADWTDGCIALTNQQVQQVFDAVADGTPIEIQP